ncbi:hypothetical protein [Kocuria rhizophila]|uniref:hypothetical protein n=1 Tax=Kocuria rhizophila TaxID=72000 RepID=UPI0011A49008|nr:hypothetical protein [Kocuria rhizophila]
MSTGAERRLREAQTILEQAAQAHQTAAAALAALEDRAVSGEDIDPLELAGAQGDAGIKAKRVQRAQTAVDAEQATVDEERARARHRELVEAAKATQVDLSTAAVRAAMEDLLRRAFASADAWSEMRAAVLAEHGEIPFYGPGNTAPDGVKSPTLVKLDGVGYPDPDPYPLARDLRDLADRVFEDVGIERTHPRPAGQEVPVSWQARAVEAGVEATREDQRRCTPEPTPDAAA